MNRTENELRKKKSKSKMLKRVVLIFLGTLLLLIALVMLLSPTLARNYINKNGEELSGRKIQVDKLKINFFTSTVQIIGGRMFEQHDSLVFIGFDSLLVDLQPLRLLQNEIKVEQLRIVNPKSRFIQNDTVFNFSDLIEFYTSEDTTADTTSTEFYALNLNQLEIKNGSVTYTDQEISHTIEMNSISFLIPHIYWGGAQESQADVSFSLGSGGRISASFDYQTETGDFNGEAKLEALDLKIILPYVQQYMKFGNMEGKLFSDIRFSGNDSDLENVTLNGDARADSLSMYNLQGKKVLGAIKTSAELQNFVPLKYAARFGKIEIDEPYIYFALEDSLSNFEKMMVDFTDEELSNGDNEEETDYDVTIDKLLINRGLIDFSDQRFREIFDYELSEVTVDMDSVSLNTDWLEIRSSMKLNKRGNLEATVGVNPLDPFQHIELEYVLSGFQLPDVNIYSKHYTGIPILFGEMYYVNKTSIVNKQLNSSNDLIITNVEMGRKTGGLYDVPIKLALFILKDINGDVKLNIPVTGDLSDPRTRVGKIIWTTFKGFMVKIVASPFKALGNLLGADPGELEEIAFSYADTTLLGKQERSLDLLLDLEKLKPAMLIEMQYLNDRKLERADAASQIMQSEYMRVHQKDAGNHRPDYLKFLKETSGQDSMAMQDFELLLAPAAQVDSIVLTRQTQRIDMVKNYLLAKNDSTQIRILGYSKDEVMNIGSRPRFAIKYLLKEDGESETPAP